MDRPISISPIKMLKHRPNSKYRSVTQDDISDEYLSKNVSQDILFIPKENSLNLIEYLKDMDRESLEYYEQEIQIYKKECSNLAFKIKEDEKNYQSLSSKYDTLNNNYDKLLKIINYLNINIDDAYNILTIPDQSELTIAKFCQILPNLEAIIKSENLSKSHSISKKQEEQTILSSIENKLPSENSMKNCVVYKRSLTELDNKENVLPQDLIKKDVFASDNSIHIAGLSHNYSADEEKNDKDKNPPQANFIKDLNKKTLKNKKKRLRKKQKHLHNSQNSQESSKEARSQNII